MLLSVVLRIVVIHVDLIMIIRNHWLLAIELGNSLFIVNLSLRFTYTGGNILERASAMAGSKWGGKTTLNCIKSLPFSNGFL